MLRHNPYSLLHSTARTKLVARSYPQKKKNSFSLFLLDFDFEFLSYIFLFCCLGSFLRVSLCVFPFLTLTLNPLNQSLNTGPESEIDLRQ